VVDDDEGELKRTWRCGCSEHSVRSVYVPCGGHSSPETRQGYPARPIEWQAPHSATMHWITLDGRLGARCFVGLPSDDPDQAAEAFLRCLIGRSGDPFRVSYSREGALHVCIRGRVGMVSPDGVWDAPAADHPPTAAFWAALGKLWQTLPEWARNLPPY